MEHVLPIGWEKILSVYIHACAYVCVSLDAYVSETLETFGNFERFQSQKHSIYGSGSGDGTPNCGRGLRENIDHETGKQR